MRRQPATYCQLGYADLLHVDTARNQAEAGPVPVAEEADTIHAAAGPWRRRWQARGRSQWSPDPPQKVVAGWSRRISISLRQAITCARVMVRNAGGAGQPGEAVKLI